MHRLFDEHRIRKTRTLDGAWRFLTDPAREGESLGYPCGLPKAASPVIVPSVWNSLPELMHYEGAAWYEKRFFSPAATLRFLFGAVLTDAAVYLDGQLLGSHYGGFSEFSFIAQNVAEGEHTLVVRADNSFDQDSIPHARADWYHYGGIIRSVMLEELAGTAILSCRADYVLSDDLRQASITFSLDLYSDDGSSADLRIGIGGQTLVRTRISPAKGFSSLNLPPVSFEGFELWAPGSPALYTLFAETGTDDLLDRIGFRRIEAHDGRILLNGKDLEIRGVCRHEEHPDWGFAVPEMLDWKDLGLIKELGANAVRGSHYPNARSFVDMLDEAGILFESEIPIWGHGYTAEDLARPLVLKRGLSMLREMIQTYYNHPSILFWCVHNEIESDTPEGKAMTALYYGETRKAGGNRLVTYATDRPLKDISLEYCDVIFVNCYIGWYKYAAASWKEFLEMLAERLKECGADKKPVIMSEFGCASLYGCHDLDTVRWSEEYQAKLLSRCLELFHDSEMIRGSFIWQFADIRTAKEMGLDRARGFNNKGIVNEYRKPKAAYFAVRNLYRRFREEGGF